MFWNIPVVMAMALPSSCSIPGLFPGMSSRKDLGSVKPLPKSNGTIPVFPTPNPAQIPNTAPLQLLGGIFTPAQPSWHILSSASLRGCSWEAGGGGITAAPCGSRRCQEQKSWELSQMETPSIPGAGSRPVLFLSHPQEWSRWI